MKLKWVVIALVMVLNLYPVAELTRCIIIYNQWITPSQIQSNYLELGIMWLYWLLTLPILAFFIDKLPKR